MIDYGVGDTVVVGGGPEVGCLTAVGTEDVLPAALYGGRARLAFHPRRRMDASARGDLIIGVDLRVLASNAGPTLVQASWDQPVADTSRFAAAIWPTVFLGYETR